MHFSIILGGHVVVLFLSNRYEEGLGTKMALPWMVFSRSASAIILCLNKRNPLESSGCLVTSVYD